MILALAAVLGIGGAVAAWRDMSGRWPSLIEREAPADA